MKLMSRMSPITATAAFVALAVLVSGCDNDNDYRGGRTYLRAGKKVSSHLSGWVAIPGAEPKITENKDASLSYAVLSAHQVVPYAMNDWKAVPPKLFKAMTKIVVEAPADNATELYVLREGDHVPYDMGNWVAVPNTQPQIETSSTQKGKGVAIISADNVIPKEMNGWVAIDKETFARLVEKYMMTGKGAETSNK